jgi:hypothetical protein
LRWRLGRKASWTYWREKSRQSSPAGLRSLRLRLKIEAPLQSARSSSSPYLSLSCWGSGSLASFPPHWAPARNARVEYYPRDSHRKELRRKRAPRSNEHSPVTRREEARANELRTAQPRSQPSYSGSYSTSFSNASSVPGGKQTAIPGSPPLPLGSTEHLAKTLCNSSTRGRAVPAHGHRK